MHHDAQCRQSGQLSDGRRQQRQLIVADVAVIQSIRPSNDGLLGWWNWDWGSQWLRRRII